ncbi:hypothetical protein B0H14DRAFT_2605005 [Mycena olivaceomarginata]|nr:hypothetical protein B0H14DRAFT_2605005 [Mycena olivaceomarginata]
MHNAHPRGTEVVHRTAPRRRAGVVHTEGARRRLVRTRGCCWRTGRARALRATRAARRAGAREVRERRATGGGGIAILGVGHAGEGVQRAEVCEVQDGQRGEGSRSRNTTFLKPVPWS